VLLRAGAAQVVAVDVGYGQLVWRLQNDERVVVHDRTNVRELTPELIGGPVDLVVGDLSFISLPLVLDALVGVTRPDGDLALMVKPQFEVGKDRIPKGGVVRDPGLRAEAVIGVATAAAARGWGAVQVATSPLPGPSGNVEFFLWLRRGPGVLTDDAIHACVQDASSGAPGVPGERVDP
jgi:23S rRNA (cytidine1920-2'-O)/16S rRNA (cytidine1409-2'-O)-methyltransferase